MIFTGTFGVFVWVADIGGDIASAPNLDDYWRLVYGEPSANDRAIMSALVERQTATTH